MLGELFFWALRNRTSSTTHFFRICSFFMVFVKELMVNFTDSNIFFSYDDKTVEIVNYLFCFFL